jgi:xylulose-5-phosphate/fructose-6-phosphate phosphoketolase
MIYQRNNPLLREPRQAARNINIPLEFAIGNETDRFSLVIDAIGRVRRLQVTGAYVKQRLRDMQIDARNRADEQGVDKPEYEDWTWPL